MTDGKYKWFALVLVWGAVFFQQGVRQIFGATLPGITDSLGVTSVEIGVVGTVFTFVYGLTVLCAGLISDFLSRKWVLVVGVLLFCIGGFFSGLASGVGALVLSYGVLNGLGQPLVFPPSMSLLMQLHEEKTRATAMSLMWSAIYVGIIVCAVGSGRLVDLGEQGWRHAFEIVGGLGLLWFVAMVVWLRDTKPPRNDEANVSLREAVLAVLSKPSALLYSAYLILLNFAVIGFMVWTPSLLKDAFPGLTMTEAVFHAVVWMNLAAVLGVMAGGRIGDRLALRRVGVRLEILAVGVVGCAFSWLLVARSHTLLVMGLALGFAGFFRGVQDSNLNVAFFDVIKPRYRASAMGFTLGLSYVFGSLAPILLGWMREHWSLKSGMLVFPVAYALALVLILVSRFMYYPKDKEE